MRQLIVQVPRGKGRAVIDVAASHGGANLSCVQAQSQDRATDVAIVHVSNENVDPLIRDLQQLDQPLITLLPWGVVTLTPPAHEVARQVREVGRLSAIEIYLGGLQSVGSWGGLIGYAVAAGVVVWIGLFTNTIYLLVAAMLIAPYAGPAMNMALGTARGDASLLGRSVARYFASLAITVAVAMALSLILRQDVATMLMVQQSLVSSVAVVLPLTAGAAGALNLCQAERNSLVSGAATGMLVAASLAPPAGLIGMSMAMGEWGMAHSGLFLLLLQLAGINVAGSIVFRFFGVSPSGVRYPRGKASVGWSAWIVTVVALAAMLTWQFWDQPRLQRASREQRAAEQVRQVVDHSGVARLVEADIRFTRADIPGQRTLLVELYVQRRAGEESDEQIRAQLTRDVQQNLRERFHVTPLVDVNVLQD